MEVKVWFTYGSLLETGIAAIGLSVIGITLAFHPTFVKDSQKTKWLSYVFVIGSLFLIIVLLRLDWPKKPMRRKRRR